MRIKPEFAILMAAGITLMSSTTASAQTIGFKVGYTASTQDRPNNVNKLTAQTGWGGGGFIRFGMMNLSMQLEALAVTKGSEEKHESADPNVHLDRNVKVDYAEIPLLVRFGGGSMIAFSPYAMVGPAIAFKTGCSEGLAEGGTSRADCGSTIKSTDVGVAGVAGLELAAGPGHILVEGRYTYGLTNVAKTPATTGDIKNRSFGVMAGYAVTLK